MTTEHTIDQSYFVYRTRKHVRIVYNPTWVFQHGFQGLWFIAYQDELTYKEVEELDVEYVGYMTRSEFDRYCDRCYPTHSRV